MNNLELSKEDKIYILSNAIEFLQNEALYRSNGFGICNAIKIELKRKFPDISCTTFMLLYITTFIPEFTHEAAIRLSSIYDFKAPIGIVYWWFRDDFLTRIAFLNALISEIEKDLLL